MKSNPIPTLQQLSSYKLGKEGIRVKLNEEGLRNIWDTDGNMNHVQGEYYVESVDYDNQSLQLVSCEDIKYSLDEIDLSWIELQLKPFSMLLEKIEHNGEKFIPIEWFEIGDEDNDSFEYDFGNIKLIRSLESLAKNELANDVNHFPFGVVQKLIEWEFDVFSLNTNIKKNKL